ncbi:cytochrome b/b6 domain-containing protein [Neotabrizicola shimadae]|uniref:Cytochrome b/b6 domain-containing protein n=1 Tax=Neotabrizicola shimadae TaxID=2807096 RepID=A0A8G0ZVY1_9RHOB|nr:cytochrome b/b6 domain-containing protein [Neotabrizicola shimadae]QYZ71132.1 cytochrome b/b6 domain-containing protein [Neotabrizicola shimadae]
MAASLWSGRVKPPALWDPVVRLTHWVIAIVVLLNAVLTEGGSTLHVAAGWTGMAMLALRLVWGLVGPGAARFSTFPPAPVQAMRHLAGLVRGRVPEYPSHNPAGAIMAYALWGLLALVTASGLYMTGGATPMQVAADQAAVDSGDWSALVQADDSRADDDGGWKDAAKEVHEVAANVILILVLLHVAGVAVESRALRRNLVAPMLLGSAARGERNRRRAE